MFSRGIIVSIQPRWNSALNNRDLIAAYAVECARHAVALRIEGIENIEAVIAAVERHGLKIPVIGLVKKKINELNTLITPTMADVLAIQDAGAAYVAMECSERCPVDRIGHAINNGLAVIADIGDARSADIAQGFGVCAVTTALAGYLNKKTHPFVAPDIDLITECPDIPVIAEGRYRTQKHLEMAREAGAYAVCIGNAIHEPRMITLHSKIIFDGSWKELSKNEFRDLP
jgi:N-acylglucosamine-6-phosphate 2-epimerase